MGAKGSIDEFGGGAINDNKSHGRPHIKRNGSHSWKTKKMKRTRGSLCQQAHSVEDPGQKNNVEVDKFRLKEEPLPIQPVNVNKMWARTSSVQYNSNIIGFDEPDSTPMNIDLKYSDQSKFDLDPVIIKMPEFNEVMTRSPLAPKSSHVFAEPFSVPIGERTPLKSTFLNRYRDAVLKADDKHSYAFPGQSAMPRSVHLNVQKFAKKTAGTEHIRLWREHEKNESYYQYYNVNAFRGAMIKVHCNTIAVSPSSARTRSS